MDEEIERLVIAVRADTSAFGRDVAAMKAQMREGLGGGADVAGRAIETSLLRAVRTGRLGFDDLKANALRTLNEIASAAVGAGIGAIGGGAGKAAGGLIVSLLGLGLPGRATGGPVGPGKAYMVGERGPELFVPTSSGAVAPVRAGAPREVRVSIAIHGSGAREPEALARSGRQVARAVARAIAQAEE